MAGHGTGRGMAIQAGAGDGTGVLRGGYHTYCKSNLCLSHISDDFLRTPETNFLLLFSCAQVPFFCFLKR